MMFPAHVRSALCPQSRPLQDPVHIDAHEDPAVQ
jgi:hypothetical protein